MKLTVTLVKENKDGSADVELNMDEAGLQFMVEQGLKATMVEAIVQEKTGGKFNVSDILGTLSKKSSKKSGGKELAKTFPVRKRRSAKSPS